MELLMDIDDVIVSLVFVEIGSIYLFVIVKLLPLGK